LMYTAKGRWCRASDRRSVSSSIVDRRGRLFGPRTGVAAGAHRKTSGVFKVVLNRTLKNDLV
jgi:hypothetical protein